MQTITFNDLVDFQVLDESGFAIGDIVYGFVEDDLEYTTVRMVETGEELNIPVYLFNHIDERNYTVTLETEVV